MAVRLREECEILSSTANHIGANCLFAKLNRRASEPLLHSETGFRFSCRVLRKAFSWAYEQAYVPTQQTYQPTILVHWNKVYRIDHKVPASASTATAIYRFTTYDQEASSAAMSSRI